MPKVNSFFYRKFKDTFCKKKLNSKVWKVWENSLLIRESFEKICNAFPLLSQTKKLLTCKTNNENDSSSSV